MINLSKNHIEFMSRPLATNSVGDYYLLSDEKKIIALFKHDISLPFKERIYFIVNDLKESFKLNGSYDFLYRRCNLPLRHIIHDDHYGIVLDCYPSEFYFKDGKLKGKIKEGILFCSEKLRNKFLEVSQHGNWFSLMNAIKEISAVIELLHSQNMVLYDLSYRTVLINPENGNIYFILWDSIGREGIDHVDVSITPNFMAPEMVNTCNGQTLYTNYHSLAVLNYMLLFHRHPLRGKRINDSDPRRDEEKTLGINALFIENPFDQSNTVDSHSLLESEKPYGNPELRPYTLSGKFFKELFDKSFINDLHTPEKRPTPFDWYIAADRSVDLLIPCDDAKCEEKWFIYNNELRPKCPFCGSEIKNSYPILNFYTFSNDGKYVSDGLRLVVTENKHLNFRHVCYHTSKFERRDFDGPLCDFKKKGNKWFLLNLKLKNLLVISDENKNNIPIGESIELRKGMMIIPDALFKERLIDVQMLIP